EEGISTATVSHKIYRRICKKIGRYTTYRNVHNVTSDGVTKSSGGGKVRQVTSAALRAAWEGREAGQ
ncbi:MAG TPA: hypothetical protein VN541_05395, partial [Tepidisphaeraceae bacterium]|nr:hypothetical protein [Tepidisphaeraceae bacterium]